MREAVGTLPGSAGVRGEPLQALDGPAGDGAATLEQYRRIVALMPAAVYTCAAPSGAITFYNERAAALWGRAPRIGADDEVRFCGSFRLYRTDGTPLPHDQTPMAVALRDGGRCRNEEVIIERPDGARITIMVNIDPIRDAAGRLTGAINVFHDTSELSQARAALRRSDRHVRQILDALPAAIYTVDAEGRLTHFNQAAARLSGRQPQIGGDGWCVSWKMYRPDGTPLPRDECPMARAIREKRPIRGEQIVAERPDGTRVWLEPYPAPLCDERGRVIGGINLLLDVTERRAADEATTRLAAIVESSEDAIISKDLDGIITSWNRGAERVFGFRADEIVGWPVTILMPPERQGEEREILERLRRGERIEHVETVRRRKDGTLLDVSLSISPIRNRDGRVVGASKIARDITERKRSEAQLRFVMAELQHRVKNTLAAVDAIARQSVAHSRTLADFTDRFGTRLRSMAVAHSLLTRADWSGAELRDILLAELSQRVPAPDRLALEGPSLLIRPKVALALHMAIHELATNAAKYGSLSNVDGRLDVAWRVVGAVDARWLKLEWREQGGPPVSEPAETGFGSEMITGVIEYELGGAIERRFEPGGLTCSMSFPLP